MFTWIVSLLANIFFVEHFPVTSVLPMYSIFPIQNDFHKIFLLWSTSQLEALFLLIIFPSEFSFIDLLYVSLQSIFPEGIFFLSIIYYFIMPFPFQDYLSLLDLSFHSKLFSLSAYFIFRLFPPKQHILSPKYFPLYISRVTVNFLSKIFFPTLLMRILNWLTILIFNSLHFPMCAFSLLFLYHQNNRFYRIFSTTDNLLSTAYFPSFPAQSLFSHYFLHSFSHFRLFFHHDYLLSLVYFPSSIFPLNSFYPLTSFTLENIFHVKYFPFRKFIRSQCLPYKYLFSSEYFPC